MDDADEEVAFAERRLVRAGAGDFPRHAGERGGEVVFLLGRAGQLDAQRALGLGGPEPREDFLAQHLLRDADADLGDGGGFLARLDVVAQVVPQVEETLKTAGGEGLELRLPEGELRAVVVEQAKLCGELRVVCGDDEVKVSWHGRRP